MLIIYLLEILLTLNFPNMEYLQSIFLEKQFTCMLNNKKLKIDFIFTYFVLLDIIILYRATNQYLIFIYFYLTIRARKPFLHIIFIYRYSLMNQ